MKTVTRYCLCYVSDKDCHYELCARMSEVQSRAAAVLAIGAKDLSLFKSNGDEISTHSDLIRLAQGAPAARLARRKRRESLTAS